MDFWRPVNFEGRVRVVPVVGTRAWPSMTCIAEAKAALALPQVLLTCDLVLCALSRSELYDTVTACVWVDLDLEWLRVEEGFRVALSPWLAGCLVEGSV